MARFSAAHEERPKSRPVAATTLHGLSFTNDCSFIEHPPPPTNQPNEYPTPVCPASMHAFATATCRGVSHRAYEVVNCSHVPSSTHPPWLSLRYSATVLCLPADFLHFASITSGKTKCLLHMQENDMGHWDIGTWCAIKSDCSSA